MLTSSQRTLLWNSTPMVMSSALPTARDPGGLGAAVSPDADLLPTDPGSCGLRTTGSPDAALFPTEPGSRGLQATIPTLFPTDPGSSGLRATVSSDAALFPTAEGSGGMDGSLEATPSPPGATEESCQRKPSCVRRSWCLGGKSCTWRTEKPTRTTRLSSQGSVA